MTVGLKNEKEKMVLRGVGEGGFFLYSLKELLTLDYLK